MAPPLPGSAQPPGPGRATPGGCLEVAALLGRRIADQAIWHENRCTWVGASLEENRGAEMALTYATLGPDLYEGTSGVALFLAELAAVTGDELFRRTAIGAIAHALTRAPELAVNLDRSLYSGRVGIAVAAAVVGTAVGETKYLEAAAQLAAGTPRTMARREFDIISGRAGSVYGLLWLSTKLGEPRFGEEALRLACELAEAADRSGASGSDVSWAAEPRTAAGNLTGFSHGASGAACALLEVAAVTGQAELAKVAEQAFSYERSLFDAGVRNWPDLRTRPGAVTGSPGPRSYPVAWCHGAAGIALARLRAYELTALPVLKHEAEVALETTFVHTEAVLRSGAGSYSLCHGLLGNAEILETGYRILGSSSAKWRDLALDVASSGIERFGRPGQAWPCGTHEGETPSLMLGLAGAGMFYLRLHEPTIGSALLLAPHAYPASLSTAPSVV
jgi:class II lanthipeptide synthase